MGKRYAHRMRLMLSTVLLMRLRTFPVYFGLSRLHPLPILLSPARTASGMSDEEPEQQRLGPDESVVWGWERFFDEVHTVQESIMSQYGTANERYAHFAVERLSTCVQAVCNVKDQLDDGQSTLTYSPLGAWFSDG